MARLVTGAIVLHTFDYLETSRIMRLMTRDAGVQSVLARGARRSRKRFGSAVDIFAQGMAEIEMRPNRELQTLTSFEVTKARAQFAQDIGRLLAGSMISELVLRTSSDEPAEGLFDALELALDGIAAATPALAVDVALAGAWRIVAALGFGPALDVCAACHAPLDPEAQVPFSHSAGGGLCPDCGEVAVGCRVIPASARAAIGAWIEGRPVPQLEQSAARAHQRLLREFAHQHLGLDRELRAYRLWEQGEWTAA